MGMPTEKEINNNHAMELVETEPAEEDENQGFTFTEFGCMRTSNKVTSCHFSSDGKYLASAGHDKKPINCLRPFSGHGSSIMSLDFHPKKNDIFCFCDSTNEIQYWNINSFSCAHRSKGASTQVRFQPRAGQLLAAVSDNVVSLFDTETDRLVHSLQAHSGVVNYVCWDATGEYLAIVCQDSVKLWSFIARDCVHEFGSNQNQFHSCVFHPIYSNLLVIGGTRSMELWNMTENRSMTVPAHENIISALAASVSGMVASAGHDFSVKLWRLCL